MRESNYTKKPSFFKLNSMAMKALAGVLCAAVLGGIIFFFTYFHVKNDDTHIQVMPSNYYTEDEIKAMILRGPLAYNSILAPIIYSKDNVEDVPFVEGYSVTRASHNSIIISVKEKEPVGCIPYLDSYIYFDRTGVFIESSLERDTSIPYFDGIVVSHVVKEEKLPIKNSTVLNTAVALSTIFKKNNTIPDHIVFETNSTINLVYGDITVQLGKDEYLDDKMSRAIAILPELQGKKGILHLESVSETSKLITFESDDIDEWKGGYDEEGNYDGTSEYDEEGNYVGPDPNAEASGDSGEDGDSQDGDYSEDYSDEYYDDYSDDYSDEYYDDYSEDYYDEGY